MVRAFQGASGTVLLIAVMIGCNASSGTKRVEEQTGPSMSSSEQRIAADETLGVEPLLIVPMTSVAPARIVDVTPVADAGRLELPGDMKRPVRPHLEPHASPAGLAARVVQGDGTAVPRVVLGDGTIVPVAEQPVAVSARTDGVWVMYGDRLVHHARDGAPVRTVALSGVSLSSSTEDAVWVTSLDAAWRVDRQGAVQGPWPWQGGQPVLAVGPDLCTRDKRDPRTLRCLSARGESSARALPDALLPLEQPLWLAEDRVVTLQGMTLRVRHGAAIDLAVTLQAAGLDASGRAFLLTATDEETVLWHQDGTRRQLPPGRLASPGAAAVDGEQILVYGQGRAVSHRDSGADEMQVGEQQYRDTVFPRVWQLAPVHAVAVRDDGLVVVSATGPENLALLAVRPAL
jgi:hypothetical protein